MCSLENKYDPRLLDARILHFHWARREQLLLWNRMFLILCNEPKKFHVDSLLCMS